MAGTPKLVPNNSPQAKANNTAAAVNTLAANMATEASPVQVYNPAAVVEVAAHGDAITEYAWLCPDGVTSVQVECYGGGGAGGGGGPTAQGSGGGGGGGEYACEPAYPVVPGETYSYFAGGRAIGGLPDILGGNNAPGASGLVTVFDPRGKGITGGVLAHGGKGGDQGGVGVPGAGGSGSVNSVHFNGGSGGSTGGNVFSDNPWVLMTDVNNLYLWYRLDEGSGNTAVDYSLNWDDSTAVFRTTGAIVGPSSLAGTPSQTPIIGVGDSGGNPDDAGLEVAGQSWRFDRGSTSHGGGYVLAPSFEYGGSGFSTLTVSCWVKGLPNAASNLDWGANTAPGQRSVVFGNSNTHTISTSGGWYLGINTSGQALFVVDTDNGPYTLQGGMVPALDGNWHMLTGVFHAHTASGAVLYVDGVAVVTVNTNDGSTLITSGSQQVAVGMDKGASGYYFNGFASNAYLSRELFSSTQVATAFGSAVAVGGGGGGGSGGSNGAGNNGLPGIGTAGGAGGANEPAAIPGINNGNSAGANGGTNANTAGGNAPGVLPYGGAGGGSASYTSAVAGIKTLQIPCARSASYCGYDATGGFAGSMYTVSEDPSNDSVNPYYATAAHQDGIVYSGGQGSAPFNGSMNSILVFPTLASVVGGVNGSTPTYLSDKTQWDILELTLNLTVETPNACTIVWSEWKSNTLPATVNDTTLAAGGYTASNGVIRIKPGVAGRTVSVALSSSGFVSDIQGLALSNGFGGQGVGILLGALQGSPTLQQLADGAWDNPEAPDWYCSFHGAEDGDTGLSASLTVTYSAHGAYTSITGGGTGDPGYIVISFLNPQGTPVAHVLPTAQTIGGNDVGAGFTAQATNYNVYDPSTSAGSLNLEVAHVVGVSPTFNAGYTAHSGGATCCFQLLPGNMLHLLLDLNCATTNVAVFTLPVGWRPVGTHFGVAVNQTTGGTTYYQIGASGIVDLGVPVSGDRFFIEAYINLSV